MRVVFDTNVFISGLNYGGKPAIVLQMVAKAECILVTSENILLEIEDVLLRKFLWSAANVAAVLTGSGLWRMSLSPTSYCPIVKTRMTIAFWRRLLQVEWNAS
jgi:predicted nucleic acid-binding protein